MVPKTRGTLIKLIVKATHDGLAKNGKLEPVESLSEAVEIYKRYYGSPCPNGKGQKSLIDDLIAETELEIDQASTALSEEAIKAMVEKASDAN